MHAHDLGPDTAMYNVIRTVYVCLHSWYAQAWDMTAAGV